MALALLDLIAKRFPQAVIATHSQRGDETVVIDPAHWKEVASWLRDSPETQMNVLVDLTAVDFPNQTPRFEVVAHLLSLARGHRLRLKARVGAADGEGAEIESLTELWASANWAERETWDMFGVRFVGHPDLRRILMYPEFEGHPLRKDYPADAIQPLVEYRRVDNIDKLPPFGADEGMSFGRQTHGRFSAAAGESDERGSPRRGRNEV
ncbi:MAG: NADH-quinone oxidoreductase subunit C [Polyangiaceae bacterium]|nr:NADH-quinone oxidoreductase subunit C [Polyangiaceae bacterium]